LLVYIHIVAVVLHNTLRSALYAFEFHFDVTFIACNILVLCTLNANLNLM
jgi:hypothetical protein